MKILLPNALKSKFLSSFLLFFFSAYLFSQSTINYENFESGNFPFALWNDGGSDCTLNTSSILSGTNSAELNDNSGIDSSIFTNNIDLTPYASVDIIFTFRGSGLRNGEDFFIEFSNNGGASWNATPIARYILGTNFTNNTTYANQFVTINNGGTFLFTSNSRFRFRCDASNDRDYIYIDEVTITGTLSGPPQPEINITGLGNNTILNGDNSPSTSDNTSYGIVSTGSSTNHVFTISNTSSAGTNLIISDKGTGILISGDSEYFTLTSEPSQNSIISGGNSLNFSIDYFPLTDGTHTATVSIDNNDSNENPYIFAIQGTAVSPNPEIDVKGNGLSIANGDIYPTTFNNTNYGSVDIGNTSTKTFTISNNGTTSLSISSITLSNTTDFQIVGTPYSSPVNSGNSTQFSIRYTGSSGKHSSLVTIENDDSDEGTYTFIIRASSKATGDASLWSVTNITSNSELNNPYEITYGPDNLLWISERVGKKIVTVNPNSGGSKTTIIDLTSVVYQTAGQDGLMGFAIHPDLYTDINTSNNLVYIAYTYDSGGGARKLRIASYRYIAGTGMLDSGTATTLIDGIDASNDHNSGRMKIGPDLKIYYTIGDQGANQFGNACTPIRAQDLPISPSDYGAYKGKVLRLNLDGSIPSDNPNFSGVKSHVFTYGHRNTQGIIFGSNGKLYASEHGAKVDDELNIIQAGKNYGWPEIAGYYDNLSYTYCNWSSLGGSCSSSGFTDHNCPSGVTPLAEYDSYPSGAPIDFVPPIGTYDSTTNYDPSGDWLTWPTVAPSSIDIYEGGLIPNWEQSLLITTLKEGTIFRAKLNTTGDALVDITTDNKYEEFHSSNDRYRDIAMDPDGITFYAITDSSGTTSGPSGSSSVTLSNPGVVMKFQYIGATENPNTTYYVDTDQDGFGDINDITGTEFPSDPGIGFSLTNNDCDDNQPLVYPGNTEILYDNIDNDCDPLTLDYEDSDNDGVIDPEDQCPGFDDNIDADADNIPDGCDPLIDSDNDGVADNEDLCPGFDDTVDTDSDSIADGCDTCPGFDDNIDVDADNIPDGCDPLIDADNDGVADTEDLCPGFDDNIDVDADNIPDGCDPLIDSDNDGVADTEDLCPGFDDAVDGDGDGIPAGCDPDDNNPCIPVANGPACNTCGDIIADSFEEGYGNWNNGGKDSALIASYANTGLYSIRLRGNYGTSSSMYTNSLDLSGLLEVSIDFSYYPISMENGEDFFLEISTNGGSSYSIVQSWASGTHFNNDNRYNESVTISNTTFGFTNNTVFRIRCDASNRNDQIYIDDVVINSCSNGQTAKNQITKSLSILEIDTDALIESNVIKVYPNPASYELFIKYEGVNSNFDVKLYTTTGQLIREITMISNILRIDLSGLSEGLYLVHISNDKGELIKTDRIIINVD